MLFQHAVFSFPASDAVFQPKSTPKIPSTPPNSLIDEADSPVAPTRRRQDPFFSDSMLTTPNTHPSNSHYEPVEKPEYQQRAFPAPGFPVVSSFGDRLLPSLSPYRRHLNTISGRVPGLRFDSEFQLPNRGQSSTTYPSLQCEGSDDVFVPSTAQTSLSPRPPRPRNGFFDQRDAAASRRSSRQGLSSRDTDSPLPSQTSGQLRAQMFRDHLDKQNAANMPSSSSYQRPYSSHFTPPQQPTFGAPQSSFSAAPFNSPYGYPALTGTQNYHPQPILDNNATNNSPSVIYAAPPLRRAYPPRPRYQPATGEGLRSRYGNNDTRAPPGIYLGPAEREITIHMWKSYFYTLYA